MAVVMALATVPLVIAGWYGWAIVVGHLAMVWTWAAVPTREYPGGAADGDGADTPHLFAEMLTFVGVIMVPPAAPTPWRDGSWGSRPRWSCSWWSGRCGSVRASSLAQLMLPTARWMRVVLVLLLIATIAGGIAAAALGSQPGP